MARIQDIAPELLQLTAAAAPPTPASGVVRIYAKTDGKLYCKDDAGNEFALVGATAADVNIADSGEHFTATNVEGALAELFTSGSDGKAALETAIETKGGTVDKAGAVATFAELEDGIDSITTGGGGGTSGDYRIRFFDYDGTILQTSYANSGGSVTPPTNPSHDGLTFQSWNYSSAALSNITSDLDVCAIYITADGKTHLHITLTTISGLSPNIYLYKSDASTLTIDWGDSNTSTFTNSGNFNTGAHTYAAAGNYIVKMWISSGSGTYSFGNSSSSSTTVGGSTQGYINTLTSVNVGSNVTTLKAYAFIKCRSLQFITMPNGITSIGTNVFDTCLSLRFIGISTDVTTIGNYAFYSSDLAFISLPSGAVNWGEYIFNACKSLSSIVFPNGLASIGDSAFAYCHSLEYVKFPSVLSSIGRFAFQYCYSFSPVNIPSSVTSIGNYAFQYCFGNSEYILNPTTPPTLGGVDAFDSINSICKIKVPAASLSAYQSASGWSTFANYMEGI